MSDTILESLTRANAERLSHVSVPVHELSVLYTDNETRRRVIADQYRDIELLKASCEERGERALLAERRIRAARNALES